MVLKYIYFLYVKGLVMVSFEDFKELALKKCKLDCKLARLACDFKKWQKFVDEYHKVEQEYNRCINASPEMTASIYAYYYLQKLDEERKVADAWLKKSYKEQSEEVYSVAKSIAEKRAEEQLTAEYEQLHADWQKNDYYVTRYKQDLAVLKDSPKFAEILDRELKNYVNAKSEKYTEQILLYNSFLSSSLEKKVEVMYPVMQEAILKKEKQYRLLNMDFQLVDQHRKIHNNIVSGEDASGLLMSLTEEQYFHLVLSLKQDTEYLALCKKIAFREKMDNFMKKSTDWLCILGIANVVGGGLHTGMGMLHNGFYTESNMVADDVFFTLATGMGIIGAISFVTGKVFKNVHNKKMKQARINDGKPLEEQLAEKIVSHIQNLSNFEEKLAKNTYNMIGDVNHYTENLFIETSTPEEK